MGDEIAIVIGTRPEAIKLAGIARALGPRGHVLHTGQHYDAAMWHNVLADLAGVDVAAHIEIGGRSRGEQIGLATTELTTFFAEHRPRAVVVQGDTNSTLAGALAASAVGIPVVHVEAGLRSHDRRMPEEINRILVDAVADLCCAPIEANAGQLRAEGVSDDRIIVTGNTLADALEVTVPSSEQVGEVLASYGLVRDSFVLSTVHRAGTVDDEQALGLLVRGLAALAERAPVVLPMHPHTAKNIARWNLSDALGAVRVVAPLAPGEFMALETAAGLIVSDSGGVQEEACLFRRPLVVLRDSTERRELLDGWCRLLGDDDPTIALPAAWDEAADWRARLDERALPYGTHRASDVIVAEIDRRWPVG